MQSEEESENIAEDFLKGLIELTSFVFLKKEKPKSDTILLL